MANNNQLVLCSCKILDISEIKDRRTVRGLVVVLTSNKLFNKIFEELFRGELMRGSRQILAKNQFIIKKIKNNNSSLIGVNTGILRGSTPCSTLLSEFLHFHKEYLIKLFYNSVLKKIRSDRCYEVIANSKLFFCL